MTLAKEDMKTRKELVSKSQRRDMAPSSSTKPPPFAKAAGYQWNPDFVFQINDTYRQQMICLGRVARRFHARCSWAIGHRYKSHPAMIRYVLHGIRQKTPRDVTDEDLRRLVYLSVCPSHRAEKHRIVAFEELRYRLQEAIRDYDQWVQACSMAAQARGAAVLRQGVGLDGAMDSLRL
jgi:hypothetical protein